MGEAADVGTQMLHRPTWWCGVDCPGASGNGPRPMYRLRTPIVVRRRLLRRIRAEIPQVALLVHAVKAQLHRCLPIGDATVAAVRRTIRNVGRSGMRVTSANECPRELPADRRTRHRAFWEQAFVIAYVFLVVVVSQVPSLTTLSLWLFVPAGSLLSLWYMRFRMPKFPELWWRAAFIVAAVASVLYAADPSLAARSARGLAGTFAVWIPVVVFVGMRGHFRAFWYAVVVSAIVVLLGAASGYGGVFVEGSDRAQRLSSELYGNPNGLSFRLFEGLMGAVYLAWTARRAFVRWALVAAASAFVWGILLSGSRKTALASLLFLTLWFVWRRIGLRSAGLIVVIAVVAFTQMDRVETYVREATPVGQRFEADAFERGADARADLIEDALRAFAEHPLGGVGLGNVGLYSRRGGVAHNDVAEIAASMGLIGLFLYFAMYVAWASRVWWLLRVRGDDDDLVFMRCVVVAYFGLGLGMPLFSSLVGMMMISSVMAYSYFLAGQVRMERLRASAQSGSPGLASALQRAPAVPVPLPAAAALRVRR
jgi:O-antigen ligase